jgi:hypothetical protein
MQPRIYTYKITFEEVSYYYYGVHKEKYFNDDYWGSPKTNKWCWDFYTPKKQILQIFDFTDKGWLEAQEVETRLIKPFYNNDKNCLNENVGNKLSLKSRKIGAKKAGKNAVDFKKGIFKFTKEERKNASSKGGQKNKESGHIQKIGKIQMKKLNTQKWKCLVTNYISTYGPLTKYQKARNIDITLRVKIED